MAGMLLVDIIIQYLFNNCKKIFNNKKIIEELWQ